MSKAGAKLGGDFEDFPTPRYVTELLLDWLLENDIQTGNAWIDPMAGFGHMVKTIRQLYHSEPSLHLWAVDINPANTKRRESYIGWPGSTCDFLAEFSQRITSRNRYSCAIVNPAFSLTQQCVDALIDDMAVPVVAVLIRQGFLASGTRREWWDARPSAELLQLPNRPIFRYVPKLDKDKQPVLDADGNPIMVPRSDSADYMWALWRMGANKDTTVHWLPKVPKERRARDHAECHRLVQAAESGRWAEVVEEMRRVA